MDKYTKMSANTDKMFMHKNLSWHPEEHFSIFLPAGGFVETAAHSEGEAEKQIQQKQGRRVNTQHFLTNNAEIGLFW